MSKTRYDKWMHSREAKFFYVSYDDDEIQRVLMQRSKEVQVEKRDNERTNRKLTDSELLEMAIELILDVVNGRYIFWMVAPVFDTKKAKLEFVPLFELSLGKENSDAAKENIKRYLALALIHDVPVYPNNEEVAPILARFHHDLLLEGFKAPDESGEDVTLVFADSPGANVESLAHFQGMSLTKTLSPAEMHLMRRAVLDEIARRDEAGRILAALRLAIEELADLLEATERNENKLQECLTRNPILFGTEYRRVIPKHKLGDEYEMDYALERVSGFVDLVEIEASTHTLFTQKGNPKKELVHAEQQVLDWLDWIERHNPYARDRLPGLVQPTAYVVIGRSNDLSAKDRERLRRRNLVLRGAFQILTYDDLLDSAMNLLRVLEGKAAG